MKHQMKYLVLAGTVAALAGCGGGGGTTLSTGETYDSMLAKAQAMGDATGVIDSGSGTIVGTALADVPADGSGTYKGYVEGDANGAGLIGDLTLEVALSRTEISGSATNFQHEVDGAYTGTLTMPTTTIQNTDPDEFSGNLTGTLTNGGTDYATDINLTGNFYDGNGTNTVAGDASISIDGGLPNPGLFIATQTP
ncbi:MAG: hypothetical protein EP320_09160 [Rhodobacteraceae bacterium]|uniref:Transferrin-binding protein B C-lobe/N-lobe beta barrel domain-containing protein n=1 Tax=Thioclava marina TaxID=1915077 RepID=A0ABX3MRG4_9RHOB|nr:MULTISPECIES: hypothetical protein [Thioclava]OOY12633.1 hypothetical protein BMG00_01945 [Thioclava marina]TNE83608.1 MAG: hypothetical protein EP337_15465 [Paracoccaceae bacterium]TNF13538.1 MAG: hypothetical protein EP320_09160 [Paracoccaceae bacterium]